MTYLMDTIQNRDAELQAALATIKMDKRVNGMRVDFKKPVVFLLPVRPVFQKWKTGSGPSATISATDCNNIKVEIRKSGPVLRFHKRAAYLALNKDQQDDLREMKSNNN